MKQLLAATGREVLQCTSRAGSRRTPAARHLRDHPLSARLRSVRRGIDVRQAHTSHPLHGHLSRTPSTRHSLPKSSLRDQAFRKDLRVLQLLPRRCFSLLAPVREQAVPSTYAPQ